MQLGAALKNIISLGSGIVEGLGYESNTLSYFITEGLREINESYRGYYPNELDPFIKILCQFFEAFYKRYRYYYN